MQFALTGARIFDGETLLPDTAVVVLEGHRILKLIDRRTPAFAGLKPRQIIELDGGVLAPGFIDLQVNGGGGALLNKTPSVEGVAAILRGHRQFGTTALLPTLISDTREVHKAAAAAVIEAAARGLRGVLGLHVEGPCFNPRRHGAHKLELLRGLDNDDIEWLTSLSGQDNENTFKVVVTLAPECTAPASIARLAAAGIRVCAGHTDASFAEITCGLEAGVSGFTHLYNAMSSLTAREPGAVGAALTDPGSWAGIIVDGHHVHPAAVKLAYRAKPEGKLYLVSDAMATVGSRDKTFQLYGETIREEQGRLVNAEGVLAGSAIGLMDAVKNCVECVGIPLPQALRMASLYPAQFLRLDHCLGRIKAGYRADLVHFSDSFIVRDTWVAGCRESYMPASND